MFPQPQALLEKARTDVASTPKSLEDLGALQTPHLADFQENLSWSFFAPPIGLSPFQLPAQFCLHTGYLAFDPPRITLPIIQAKVTFDPIAIFLKFLEALLDQQKDLV